MRNSWVLILLFITTTMWAGIEKTNIRKRVDTLHAGLLFSFQEDKFSFMYNNSPQWKNQFEHAEVKNHILIGFDKFSDNFIGNYAVKMEFSVTYLVWNNVYQAFQAKTIPSVVLEIEHTPSSVYTDKQMYRFFGGHQIQIKLEKLYVGTTLANAQEVTGDYDNVVPNLYLESEISVERYYNFNQTLVPAGPTAGTIANNQLPLTWPFIEGAEEYELEWTHLDNFENSSSPTDERNPADIAFSKAEGFRFNSSRIVTTSTSYQVPVLYEHGYLLYRIRGVGRNKKDNYTKNVYTHWSDQTYAYNSVAAFPHKTKLTGHENNLNWQNSISFAEEGKNKASISYYDGSLRNRQVVTKMNSQNETVVGETIYDQQGRPAIQVLPVPTGQASLDYNKDINKDLTGHEYNRNDFDNSNSNCVQPAPSMHTGYGAANYYSPNNPDKTKDENNNIPDAQGKPFTQTVYTPDNTGRIKAQSGVGPTHAIGQGHETKYFYSKPFQNELTRLFGTEVGNAARYKKNMVIDANGQISVSYLDPQGRVVATALAGAPDVDLSELQSASTQSNTEEIFELNEAGDGYIGDVTSPDFKKKELSTSIPVSNGGTRTFTYNYTNIPFIALCEAEGIFLNQGDKVAQNRCYECVMDLKIELKDDCGNSYFTTITADATQNSGTIGKTIIDKLKQQGAYQFNCSTNVANREASPVSAVESTPGSGNGELVAGTYTISRVLSVNEEALELYIDKYLADNACLLTLPDFIEGSTIDVPVDCYQGCEQCYETLGDYPQYDPQATNGQCNPCMSYEEYQEELQACAEICEPKTDDCSALKDAMMGDVSPSGQYGAILGTNSTGGTVTIFDSPSSFPTSVYNWDNYLPRKSEWYPPTANIKPNWLNPQLQDASGNIKYYYVDENGLEDFVEVKIQDGVYTPEVADQSKVIDRGGKSYISPQYLQLSAFLDNFKPSWALSLIIYHPEYGYYHYCRRNQASQDFDSKWQNMGDYVSYFKEDGNNDGIPDHEAERLGLLNPLGTSPNNSFDPFFNPTKNPYYRTYDRDFMANKFSSFVTKDGRTFTMKQVAIMTTICVNRVLPITSPPESCSGLSCTAFNKNGAVDETEDWTNETWSAYMSNYMTIKKTILEAKMTQHAIRNGYYNGCIGKSNFNPLQDKFKYSPYPRSLNNSAAKLWNRYAHIPNLSWFHNRSWFHYSSQNYNYQQPCNCYNAVLYADKNKIYMRNSDGMEMGNPALNNQYCAPATTASLPPDFDYDPGFQFEDPNCEATVANALDVSKKMAAFKYYEDCGNCIQVQWFEALLSGIAESKYYTLAPTTLDEVVLNCYSSHTQQELETLPSPPRRNDITGYSPEVDTRFFATPTPSNAVVKWIKNSETNGLLNASIHRSNDNATSTVVMKMNPVQTFTDESGVDHTFTFSWSDVKSVCCLSPISVSAMGLPTYSNRMFSAYVYVDVVFSSTERRVETIKIEGYTLTYDLRTCDPPKSCSVLPIGRELMSFWNGLTYSAPSRGDNDDVGEVTNHFVVSSFVVDDDVKSYSPTPTIYEDIITDSLSTALLKGNPNNVYWTWESSGVSTNVLTTILKTKDVSTGTEISYTVTFTMDGATMTTYGITWANLLEFTNIMPDETSADPSRNFVAVAKIITNGVTPQVHYVTVKGYSNDIVLGNCRVAQPPASNSSH